MEDARQFLFRVALSHHSVAIHSWSMRRSQKSQKSHSHADFYQLKLFMYYNDTELKRCGIPHLGLLTSVYRCVILQRVEIGLGLLTN